MLDMNCDFIEKNWIDLLTMLATFGTLYVAWKALSTWRQEKQHELEVEVYSLSRRAADMIVGLRDPVFYESQISESVLQQRNKQVQGPMDGTEKYYLMFLSRMEYYEKLHSTILELRERLWANYSDKHIFYTYYEYIILTIRDINSAHRSYYALSDFKTFNEPADHEERKKLRKIIIGMSGDEINTKLKRNFEALTAERSKQKHSS